MGKKDFEPGEWLKFGALVAGIQSFILMIILTLLATSLASIYGGAVIGLVVGLAFIVASAIVVLIAIIVGAIRWLVVGFIYETFLVKYKRIRKMSLYFKIVSLEVVMLFAMGILMGTSLLRYAQSFIAILIGAFITLLIVGWFKLKCPLEKKR